MTEDFAAVMQKLSAEAEKTLGGDGDAASSAQLGAILTELRALNSRLERVENAVGEMSGAGLMQQLRRFDEQLGALRESESVNHRLFDSLHDELIRYRDNFLHESLQKPFIRDLLVLFDDLSAIAGQIGRDNSGVASQSCQNLDNALHALLEILHRLEVNEVEPRERVDRSLHRVVSFEPAEFQEDDGRIIMRLKRGFMWRDKVLRPEEVVAKRFE